jgi:probable phosphoglycerate mutase
VKREKTPRDAIEEPDERRRMMPTVIPLPPKGFVLDTDEDAQASSVPAPPPGFTLEPSTQEADAAIESVTRPQSTRKPTWQSSSLDLGKAPSKPRSTAEGLVTEQQERRGGMPLAIQPANYGLEASQLRPQGIQPVPRSTSTLAPGAQPSTKMEPFSEPGSGGLPGAPLSPEQAEGEVKFLSGAEGWPQMKRGLEMLPQGAGRTVPSRFGWQTNAPEPPISPEEAEARTKQSEQAATEILSGAGKAMTPVAIAGAIAAPIPAALALTGAFAGSYSAGKLADVAKTSPETKALLEQVGGFLGATAGGVAGAHGGAAISSAVSPEDALTDVLFKRGYIQDKGGQAVHFTSPDQARAVAQEIIKQNPTGWVDSYKTAQMLRRQAETMSEPTPEEMGQRNAAAAQQRYSWQQAAQEQEFQRATAAAKWNQAAEQPAQPILSPAEAPPMHHVSQEEIDEVGQKLAQIPVADRPQATLDAHTTLAAEMIKQGRFVGPDGKLYNVTSEKQAGSLAQKWLNESLGKRDVQAKEAANQPVPAPPAGFTLDESSKETTPSGSVSSEPSTPTFAKGDRVTLPNGDTGNVRAMISKNMVRVQIDGGGRAAIDVAKLRPIASGEAKAAAGPAVSARPASSQEAAVAPPKGFTEEKPAEKPSAVEGNGKQSVIWARHGETALDQEGSNETVAGWTDEPLDERGKASAQKLAENIKEQKPTVIVSSDLARAKQTADIVGKQLGIPVKTDEHFRPQHVPETEGKKIGEAKPIWKKFEDNPDLKPEGGESWNEFAERHDEALKDVQGLVDKGERPMVVTHSRNLENYLHQRPEPGGHIVQEGQHEGTHTGAVGKASVADEVKPAAGSEVGSKSGGAKDEALVPAEQPKKYKFGNTQANIHPSSEAAKALESARARISDSDLAGKGKEIGDGGNHVTVRYGIQGEDTEGIKKFLSQQSPFEASLGKTEKFPPSEHSDGAAVIVAPIEAKELHRLNSELEKHGDFTEPSFAQYRPHATVAYVRPEVADRYTGMSVTAGKKFTVDRVAITDRNGKAETVKLEGKTEPRREAWRAKPAELTRVEKKPEVAPVKAEGVKPASQAKTGIRESELESQIKDLKTQAESTSKEFSSKGIYGYSTETKPLRDKYNDLMKQMHEREDELSRLRGEPTRSEKREMQEKEVAKAFADRPKTALTYEDPKQSQHWQVLEPDYIEKRFNDKVKQYERAIPEKQTEVSELKAGSTKRITEQANLKYWKELLESYKDRDPRQAQKFKTEYRDLVKKAVSHGSPVPDEVIAQHLEFSLARDARERYEKGRHTSFANKSVAVNDTMRKEEGFKVKRQDGKPITEEQIKEISTGVDEMVKVLGPELRDMMRGTDLTISHTNGKHPFLSDAGGMYHPVDRTISAGIDDFLGRPVRALAHELGHWLDYESGRVLNTKALIRPKSGGASTETHYVSEADRSTKPLYELARRTMSDTRQAERMVKTVKLADLPEDERAKIERMKVVLGAYWHEPRELWARMFEQYIATKLGRGSLAAESPERYQNMPAWWTSEAWKKIEPLFEEALKSRMDAMRERYAPATIEGVSAAEPTVPRQPAWKSEPEPVVEAKPHREVISTEKNAVSSGKQIAGADGSETKLHTNDGEQPAKYRVVEASSLKPSHNAQTFAKNPDYPSGVQERAYDISKEAQNRVIQQSQHFNPDYLINSNPDAVNGPPVITPDGTVLGGNSRTMTVQRVYANKNFVAYKHVLIREADKFGLDKEAVRKMDAPVLVREVATPKTQDEMRALGTALNKSMTGALGVSERAVSAGKAISRETLANISGMLDGIGKDASLRDLMRERGKDVLAALVKDGAITERERPQFVDTATGGLSEEGKTFVERALLGSVVDDPRLMDSTPKSVLNKLDGSLAALASVAPRTDAYNILPLLRESLREHGEIAARGTNVEDYLSQTGLFNSERDPAVDALTRVLAGKSLAARERFRRFAEDANFDVQGQGTLGLIEQPSPAKAFNDAFGANLTDEDLENSILKAVQSDPTITANGGEAQTVRPAEAGAGNLQRSQAGEPRPSGESGTGTPEKARPETKLNLLAGESGEARPGELAKAVGEAAGTVGNYVREVAKATKYTGDLQRDLQTLDTAAQAEILRAKATFEKLKKQGLDKASDEAIYHYLEDPEGVKLNGKQDDFLDDVALPIKEKNEEWFKELTEGGIPIENYVSRSAKGKGGMLDRIATTGTKGVAKKGTLSKAAPQTKTRTMMAIESPDGTRKVVSIKGGKATLWQDGEPTELGEIKNAKGKSSKENETWPDGEPNSAFYDQGKVVEGPDGYDWKVTQATTKEIEAQTDIKYYHSAFASLLSSNIQLGRAVRAMRFLEAFKSSPEFKEISWRGNGYPPYKWKATSLPQFRGVYFELRTAETLDDYADRLRGGDFGILQKTQSFLRAAFLVNPIVHPLNILASWSFEKGLSGFAPWKWKTIYQSGNKAIKAVTSLNDDFKAALDAGGALQSHRAAMQDMHKLFFDRLAEGFDKKEHWAMKIARALGIEKGNLLNFPHKLSSIAAWTSSDIMYLQAAYQYQAEHPGTELSDALKEVGRIIPEYRIPTRILDQRWLSKVMTNPLGSWFGQYHYGLLHSLGQAAKSALGAQEPTPGRTKAEEVGKGWDRLALLGLITLALYPYVFDKEAKKLTGNEHARWRRPGPFGIVDAAEQVMEGKQSAGAAVEKVFTPSPISKAAVELLPFVDRELSSGRQIYDPHANWQTQGEQIGRYLMGEVGGQYGQYERAETSEQKHRFMWQQAGVQMGKTRAEKTASDIAMGKMGTEAEDPADRENHVQRREILDQLRKGNRKPLEEAQGKHELTHRQVLNLEHRSRLNPLEDTVTGFSISEVEKVLDAAKADKNEAEIKLLTHLLAMKKIRAYHAAHEAH